MPRDRSTSSTTPKKSKRQEFREMRRQRDLRNRVVVVAGIVLAALLFVVLAAGPAIRAALAPVGEIVPITPVARPQVNDNAMGDPNAPVVIEEFSGYQCSYCKLFSEQTEPLIVENYVKTGKVYFIYRSLGGVGTEAGDAAEAAYCAGEQNKYWEYHDILFANFAEPITDKRLRAFAETLELDTGEFNACLRSGRQATRVAQDGLDGAQYGINSTPSFVINGMLAITGAQPYEEFQRAIDAVLATE
ncbi:MAG: DsbA family protein [Chloroflexota bacterium]